MTTDVDEGTYAGVLGKIIGVYLGRPVEGWPYQQIIDTFGDVPYYVHESCGVPLIVADDDISGTFGFFRTLLDHGASRDIPAAAFGKNWLNQIIEDRTILWWGGRGRSTEHTAWLNLVSGSPSPQSGSIALNSRTLAEQIGAQIFIDAIAMACPGDPELAAALVEKAASVSHDGLAVQAARHLAAMEALAFVERDITKILAKARPFVTDEHLLHVIDDVTKACAELRDWRAVREYIEVHHGYSLYPGPCHMVPNHAAVIAAILLGGDDFQQSIRIATSMGWDTDCNAGNVGAFNGIRLGLAGINAGADFRTPVADRLLVVTAVGGSTVSDAVIQTRLITDVARLLRGEPGLEPRPRFAFEYPGSTQGWAPCPYLGSPKGGAHLVTASPQGDTPGLAVCLESIAPGTPVAISTPTFLDFSQTVGNFSTIASPTLYEGQELRIDVELLNDSGPTVRPYVLSYDLQNEVQKTLGPPTTLQRGLNHLDWVVPNLSGMPIFRVGLHFDASHHFSGNLRVMAVDWAGAPRRFAQTGMLMTSIWATQPHWVGMWCSSAKHFAADFTYTLCVSHPGQLGVATIGTTDWDHYRVTSQLEFALHEAGGLVARAQGHRRYYAALMSGHDTVSLIKSKDHEITVLASAPFPYSPDRLYTVEFDVCGSRLSCSIDSELLLEAEDAEFVSGEAGFVVTSGSFTANGFAIEALPLQNSDDDLSPTPSSQTQEA